MIIQVRTPIKDVGVKWRKWFIELLHLNEFKRKGSTKFEKDEIQVILGNEGYTLVRHDRKSDQYGYDFPLLANGALGEVPDERN